MTTIDDRLRDLGDALRPPPLPGASAVMQRGRQRRNRRRGRLAAVLVAAGAGGAAGATALWPDGDPSVRTSTAGVRDAQPGTTPTTTPTTTPATTTTGGSTVLAVPDVTGLGADQARQVLEDLGLLVEVVGDGPEDAVVLSQEPAVATSASPGDTIRLEIG